MSVISDKEKFLSRNRGGCCGGSQTCALNQIVAKTDGIFALYDKDKRKAVDLLDNIFCDMGEEIDMLKAALSNLRKELHTSKQLDGER